MTGPVTGVRQHQVPVIAHPRSTTLGPGLIVVGADVDPVRSTELLRAGERPGLDQREAGKTEERQHVLFSHSRLYFTCGTHNRSFYRRLSGEGRSTVHIRQLIIHNSGISIKFTLLISRFSYSMAIFKSIKVFICRENKSWRTFSRKELSLEIKVYNSTIPYQRIGIFLFEWNRPFINFSELLIFIFQYLHTQKKHDIAIVLCSLYDKIFY